MWCLADPKTRRTRGVPGLLTTTTDLHLRTGQILLADKGLAGARVQELTAAHGLSCCARTGRDETDRHGNLGGVRQWIESVFDTLKGQLGLERHGGRTRRVFTRVAQRLLALAAAIWHNWTTGAPANDHSSPTTTEHHFTESII